MTRVSVLVPAYERPDSLRKTLDSIMTQETDDYEVIITDDSPTDLVERVVREQPLQAKIRYERNPKRLGQAQNCNRAASLASGEYLKYLHSDDSFASPRALSAFCWALEEHPDAGMAFCASRYVDPAGKELATYWPTRDALRGLNSDFKRTLLERNIIGVPSATIYRRSLHRPLDAQLNYMIDIDLYMTLLQQNPRFVFIPKALIDVTDGSDPVRVTSHSEGVLDVEVREANYLWKKWCGDAPIGGRAFAGVANRLTWRNPRLELDRLSQEERDFLLHLLYRDFSILSYERNPKTRRWRTFLRAVYDLAPDWFKNVTRTIRRKARTIA